MTGSRTTGGLFSLGGQSGTSSRERWRVKIVVFSDCSFLKPRRNDVEKEIV